MEVEVQIAMWVLGLVVNVIIAFLVAKWYGDVAGTEAARRFQEEDAARARVAAFQSLISAVGRAREVVDCIMDGVSATIPRMPTAAFEVAFVPGWPGLPASPKLVDVVNDYLVIADSMNFAFDLYVSRGGGEWANHMGTRPLVFESSGESIVEVLDRLEDYLERELEEAQRNLAQLGF